VHADLAAALALARDLTAEVADAAELGGAAAVEPLLPEWRGALFRVRLARRRFAQRSAAPSPPVDAAADDSLARPLIAFLLAFFGALAVVAGAATAVWEIWSAGLVAVLGSVLAYRP
jgi:hypothetical protein